MKMEEWEKLKRGTDIYFKDNKFTLIDDTDNCFNSTPLCTKKQFDNFEESTAHIYWNKTDSEINRYGVKIGTIEDISLSKAEASNEVIR